MKKYYIVVITLLIVVSGNVGFSQIATVKSKVNEIFFGFPKSSEKFDIKLIVNSSEIFMIL